MRAGEDSARESTIGWRNLAAGHVMGGYGVPKAGPAPHASQEPVRKQKAAPKRGGAGPSRPASGAAGSKAAAGKASTSTAAGSKAGAGKWQPPVAAVTKTGAVTKAAPSKVRLLGAVGVHSESTYECMAVPLSLSQVPRPFYSQSRNVA